MTKNKTLRVISCVALLIVCVVALLTPLYNFDAPRLFSLPFFVWFQILWVIVAAIVTGAAYWLTRD